MPEAPLSICFGKQEPPGTSGCNRMIMPRVELAAGAAGRRLCLLVVAALLAACVDMACAVPLCACGLKVNDELVLR